MAGKLRLTGKLAETARKMLRDVCSILDENGIPYVLDNGTLLGVVRDGGLIPWDNDLDIAVKQDYLDRLIRIRYRFWLAGYRTRIRRSTKDMPQFPRGSVRIIKVQTRKLFFKGVTLLDIFIKKETGDRCYWTMGSNNPILLSAPKKYYEDVTRREFNGYEYPIPRDYETYLAHRYGDWKTPVREFDYRKDDLAIVGNDEYDKA